MPQPSKQLRTVVPIIVFGIAFLSVLVCIFYLWLIKIGALGE